MCIVEMNHIAVCFLLLSCELIAVTAQHEDISASRASICNQNCAFTSLSSAKQAILCEIPISEIEVVSASECSAPPKAPQNLKVGYGIIYGVQTPFLALNISWTGGINQMYVVTLSPCGSSVNYEKYLYVNGSRNDMNQVLVGVDYNCFGLSDHAILTPECRYFISVTSFQVHETRLPNRICYSETAEPAYADVYIPSCDDEEVRNTNACVEKAMETTPKQMWKKVETTRAYQTSTNIYARGPGIASFAVPLSVCAVAIIILATCSKIKFFSDKDQQTIKKKSFLIVISSSEYHKQANGSYAEAGDKIACYLKSIGMKVMYTLWKATEIDNSDTFQWICNQLKMTQHLIIIYSQQCTDDQCSNEIDDTKTVDSETPILTANKQDPLKVVKEMITRSNSSVKRYSIVTFNSQKDEWIMKEIPQSRVFQLPKHIQSFCRDIIGVVRKQDVNRMKQELTALNL